MSIHISLLQAFENMAKIHFIVMFGRQIIFEKEFDIAVAQTFSLNNIKIETSHPEQNRYDIRFSDN